MYDWKWSNEMADIRQISDFDDPALDVYARMSGGQLLNRHEPEKGLFIAESPKVIERALDAGCVPVSCLVEDRQIEGEAASVLARLVQVPVYTAPFSVLTQLTGFKLTRGMLCAMKRPAAPKPEKLCCGSCRLAILEHVVNPTNVGAIIRSAAALGMDGVLLTPDCSDPLYRRAIRVSMGTVFQIPWAFFPEDVDWMEFLKTMGIRTVAMALRRDTVAIDDPKLLSEERLAIILGTEGEGLEEETIDRCDYTVKIPMAAGVDSLNVAAASAVAFWELGRKGGRRE